MTAQEKKEKEARYLMNIHTGSVDTEESWRSEYEAAKAAGFPEEMMWSESDWDSLMACDINGNPIEEV